MQANERPITRRRRRPATPEAPREPRRARGRRRRPDAPPLGIYLGLGAVAAITAAAALWRGDVPLIERFGANLATEAIGILVTLIVVHRFLERQERARRLRGSIGALRKSGRALSRMAHAWATILKGCRRTFAGGPPQRLHELFAPHVADALLDLDPARTRTDEEEGDERWLDWLVGELTAARDSLAAVVVGYGNVMDPVYIEAVDELLDDPFIDGLQHLAAVPGLTAVEWRRRLNHARGAREAHFERLVFLFSLHNDFAREASVVRAMGLSQRTGQLGVSLPADYDLRVQSPLVPAWWHEPPAPGELCT